MTFRSRPIYDKTTNTDRIQQAIPPQVLEQPTVVNTTVADDFFFDMKNFAGGITCGVSFLAAGGAVKFYGSNTQEADPALRTYLPLTTEMTETSTVAGVAHATGITATATVADTNRAATNWSTIKIEVSGTLAGGGITLSVNQKGS